jgi:hypothetical protein
MDYINLHFTGFADNYNKVWSKKSLNKTWDGIKNMRDIMMLIYKGII